MRAALAVILCGLMLCLGGAFEKAHAHAALLGSMPADGMQMSSAPTTLWMRFSEAVSPLRVQIVYPDGAQVEPLFKLRGERIEIEAPGGMGEGTYILGYRVMSEDGHPVGGSISFSVGARSTPAAFVPGGDVGVSRVIWLVKWLGYIGLFFGAATAASLSWLSPSGVCSHWPARVARFLIPLGGLCTVLAIGLQGASQLEIGLSGLLQGGVWRSGAASSLFNSALVQLVALGLSWRVLSTKSVPQSVLVLVLMGVSYSLTGHASFAEPRPFVGVIVALHVTLAAVWSGALLPLLGVLAGDGPQAHLVLHRFSRVAVPALLVMIALGLLLGFVQLGSAELVASGYVVILFAKIAAVIGLLGLAALNRQYLTPAIAAGRPDAHGRMSRVIGVEILLMAVIFGLVAGWRFTPPPRTLPSLNAGLNAHIHGQGAMIDVVLSPGETGANRARLLIMDNDMEALNVAEVQVHVSHPDGGIDELVRKATRANDGSWSVSDVPLPMSGRWIMRVDLLISDFDKLILEGDVVIGKRKQPQ